MKTLDRQTRFDSVDLFKFIGSYFVIAIHTNVFSSFSTEFNWMFVNIVARIAVYFYFVASAFLFFRGIEFCDGKITKSKENLIENHFDKRVYNAYIVFSYDFLEEGLFKFIYKHVFNKKV